MKIYQRQGSDLKLQSGYGHNNIACHNQILVSGQRGDNFSGFSLEKRKNRACLEGILNDCGPILKQLVPQAIGGADPVGDSDSMKLPQILGRRGITPFPPIPSSTSNPQDRQDDR